MSKENETAFCELLRLALDHAPNDEARAALEAVRNAHCGVVTNDTGNDGPPPKQP